MDQGNLHMVGRMRSVEHERQPTRGKIVQNKAFHHTQFFFQTLKLILVLLCSTTKYESKASRASAALLLKKIFLKFSGGFHLDHTCL